MRVCAGMVAETDGLKAEMQISRDSWASKAPQWSPRFALLSRLLRLLLYLFLLLFLLLHLLRPFTLFPCHPYFTFVGFPHPRPLTSVVSHLLGTRVFRASYRGPATRPVPGLPIYSVLRLTLGLLEYRRKWDIHRWPIVWTLSDTKVFVQSRDAYIHVRQLKHIFFSDQLKNILKSHNYESLLKNLHDNRLWYELMWQFAVQILAISCSLINIYKNWWIYYRKVSFLAKQTLLSLFYITKQ